MSRLDRSPSVRASTRDRRPCTPPAGHSAVAVDRRAAASAAAVRARNAACQPRRSAARYQSALPELLRRSCARWLERRGRLGAKPSTRPTWCCRSTARARALFAFVQAMVDGGATAPTVVMPNPFYQIYEGAALLAGRRTLYSRRPMRRRPTPDLDAVPPRVWRRCQLLFLCSPGNPTGAVSGAPTCQALELARPPRLRDRLDECYRALRRRARRAAIAARTAARKPPAARVSSAARCSTASKRSSLPGLRFRLRRRRPGGAGACFPLYRTYHGCAMPVPTQLASIAARNDDAHARNRRLYRASLRRDAAPVLTGSSGPPAASTSGPGPAATTSASPASWSLREERHQPCPAATCARGGAAAWQSGRGRVCAFLVASADECIEAAAPHPRLHPGTTPTARPTPSAPPSS